MSLGQGTKFENIQWHKEGIMAILASFGGQAVSIIAIMKLAISQFQSFTYKKQALKELYQDSCDYN